MWGAKNDGCLLGELFEGIPSPGLFRGMGGSLRVHVALTDVCLLCTLLTSGDQVWSPLSDAPLRSGSAV